MVGEEESVDSPDALNKKPVWQRLIIMAAGAMMNILFGILITALLVCMSKAIGTTTVAQFNEGAVSNAEGGLCVGDRIVKIGNDSIHITSDISYAILHDGSEPVDITVIRDGKKQVLNDVKFMTDDSQGITIGVMDFKVARAEKNFGTVAYNAFYEAFGNIEMIFDSLRDLVTGRYGLKAVSGPVGVTTAIGDAASHGFSSLLYIVAFISMNLGVFNLLPFPALDGGHIVFLLFELVRGKPVKPEHEAYVHFAGIVILLLLMAVVTVNDIIKLF